MKKRIILFIVIASHYVHSCGVVGYVGNSMGQSFIVEGLTRMQHLGHDSAGFAYIDKELNTIVCIKAIGYIDALKKKLKKDTDDGHLGIGHTRRASQGRVSERNAHPHLSNDGSVAVVHNGNLQNYHQLKKILMQKGCQFKSETDTEAIAQLFADRYGESQLLYDTTLDVVQMLRGSYTSILMHGQHPDTLIVIRKGPAIYLGIGDNEICVATLVIALRGKADRVIALPDESFTLIKKDGVEIYNFQGMPLIIHPRKIGMKRSLYDYLEYAACIGRNALSKNIQCD